MIVIRDPKTFYFNFVRPTDVNENLKHEIEFIIKSNESLAENKTRRTRKTAKQMSHINFFLTCYNDMK